MIFFPPLLVLSPLSGGMGAAPLMPGGSDLHGKVSSFFFSFFHIYFHSYSIFWNNPFSGTTAARERLLGAISWSQAAKLLLLQSLDQMYVLCADILDLNQLSCN